MKRLICLAALIAASTTAGAQCVTYECWHGNPNQNPAWSPTWQTNPMYGAVNRPLYGGWQTDGAIYGPDGSLVGHTGTGPDGATQYYDTEGNVTGYSYDETANPWE